jgi:hypothetical protein
METIPGSLCPPRGTGVENEEDTNSLASSGASDESSDAESNRDTGDDAGDAEYAVGALGIVDYRYGAPLANIHFTLFFADESGGQYAVGFDADSLPVD